MCASSAARPASSRRRSACSPPRPRSRRGSRGPAPCGSGCSGGSGRCSTAGRWRGGLVEGGVQPAVAADQAREGVEVGRLQLRQLAPVLDLLDDRVLVANRLEHAGVGREAGLAAPLPRQPELVEQDRRELLRRADRELLSRQLPDLALELGVRSRAEAPADLGEPLTSSFTPARSISISTSTSGSSTSCNSLVSPTSSSRARWRSARTRVSTARSATRRRPSHRAGSVMRSFVGEPARRAGSRAARGRSGRRPPSCRARAAARRQGSSGARDRLPVVRYQRARRAPSRRRRASRPRPAPRPPPTQRRAGPPGRRVEVERPRPASAGNRQRRLGARPPRLAPPLGRGPRSRALARPRPPAAAPPSPRARRRAGRAPPSGDLARLARTGPTGRSAGAAPSSPSASSRRSSGRAARTRGTSRGGASGRARARPRREVDLDRHVPLDRGELLRHARVVGVLHEVLLALGARDRVDLDRAPPRGRRTPGTAGTPSSRRCPGRPGCCPRCRP